jgi:hypothetical protein
MILKQMDDFSEQTNILKCSTPCRRWIMHRFHNYFTDSGSRLLVGKVSKKSIANVNLFGFQFRVIATLSMTVDPGLSSRPIATVLSIGLSGRSIMSIGLPQSEAGQLLLDNCPPDNCPMDNCPPDNCPPDNCPMDNCPPDNCPLSPPNNCPPSQLPSKDNCPEDDCPP